MRIVELIIDEMDEFGGIDAISIVESPAIQSDFITLAEQVRDKEEKTQLAEVDKERKILMGPALIPNKMIYRKNGDDEFYIHFSKETVRKASELFLKRGKQNRATYEHQVALGGLSVIESWIVDDPEMDKNKAYGLNMPKGTWMVSMKVYDDTVWNEFVKTGQVKGFSIEGFFEDKAMMSEDERLLEELREMILK